MSPCNCGLARLRLALAVVCLALLVPTFACGPKPPTPVGRLPTSDLPDVIRLALSIADYTIINHRILTGDLGPLRGVRYSGKYSDGSRIYLRLEGVPHSREIWIAPVPDVPDGDIVVTAKRITSYRGFDLDQLPDPPREIHIAIEVRDRQIVANRIADFDSRTFGLYVDSARHTSRGKVVVIASRIYSDSVWECLLPKTDGDFELIAVRKR